MSFVSWTKIKNNPSDARQISTTIARAILKFGESFSSRAAPRLLRYPFGSRAFKTSIFNFFELLGSSLIRFRRAVCSDFLKKIFSIVVSNIWTVLVSVSISTLCTILIKVISWFLSVSFQARAQSARARRACALRALGLLLADGTPTVGGGKTF